MKTNQTLSLLGAVAVSAAVLGLVPTAQAVPLNEAFVAQPFLDTPLGGTTFASRPELGGLVLEDVIKPFSFATLGLSGTVQNRVVREFSTGTLDFYWRIKVNPESPVAAPIGISAFRLDDFGYSDIKDADWRIDGLGSAAPTTGRVFNPATHPEGAINFLFDSGQVLPGDPSNGLSGSRFFFLHTDATSFAETASYDLLGGPDQTLSPVFSTFAPATSVPDSGSAMVLLLLGLGGLAVHRRLPGYNSSHQ